MLARSWSLALALILSGCAHTPSTPRADPALLRSTAESFHRRVRWKDFQGASGLVVPERRAAFLAAREALNDERDLTISDYELLELRVEPDLSRAFVVSRLAWSRLPSVTEQTQTITTELVPAGNAWLVARQDRGPFTDALGEPYEAPAPVAP